MPRRMTPAAAIHALMNMDTSDPEATHSEADKILLNSVDPSVREAYEDLAGRCRWWAAS